MLTIPPYAEEYSPCAEHPIPVGVLECVEEHSLCAEHTTLYLMLLSW